MNRCLIALFVVALALTALAMPVFAGEGETCFKSREYVSGMNKICFYGCLGGDVAITVRNIDFCPLSIRR